MSVFKKTKKNTENAKQTPKQSAVLPQVQTGSNKFISSVLKRPYVSEKSQDQGKQNKYVFLVENSANKLSVKNEIQSRYGVKVTDVNIVKIKGKIKKWANKLSRREDIKKAIITLKEGHKIEIGL